MADPVLITTRSLIRDVAAQWHRAYTDNDVLQDGRRARAIYDRLCTLDVETATADDVAAIIGNDSWTAIRWCDGCGDSVEAVVRVGQKPDYESSTATLCVPCLQRALALVEEAARGET